MTETESLGVAGSGGRGMESWRLMHRQFPSGMIEKFWRRDNEITVGVAAEEA